MRIKYLRPMIVAALCTIGCGNVPQVGERSDRIGNGDPTDGIGYGVVKVAIDTGMGQAGCSGTLVRSDVVLTARHCVTTNFDSMGPTLWPPSAFTVDLNGNQQTVTKVADNPADPFHFFDVALLRLNGSYPDSFRPVWGGTQAELDGQLMTCFGYAVDNLMTDCPPTGPCLGPLRDGVFTQNAGEISYDFGYTLEEGDSGGPCIFFQFVTNPITHISYCPFNCPGFLATVHNQNAADHGVETPAPDFADWVATTLSAGFIIKGSLEWSWVWDGIKSAFPPAGLFAPAFAGAGSTNAERSLLDGTSDIGLLARPIERGLLREAAALGIPLQARTAALAPIGIFVQRRNSLASLDLATLRKLYAGADGSGSADACASRSRPRDWRQLGVDGAELHSVHLLRPDPAHSDLSSEFQRLVRIKAFCSDVRVVPGRAAAGLAVLLDPDALAFDSLDAIDADLNRMVPIATDTGEFLPTEPAVRSGSYPLTRPLVVLSNTGTRNRDVPSLASWLTTPSNLARIVPGPVLVACNPDGCGDVAPAVVER